MKVKPASPQATTGPSKPESNPISGESKQPAKTSAGNSGKYQDQFEKAKKSTIDHFLSKPPAAPQPKSLKQEQALEGVADCDPMTRLELAGSCIPMRRLEPVAGCDPMIRGAGKTVKK